MKIAISGYGKMGKEIEKIAIARKHEITVIIDSLNEWEQFASEIKQADVIIDFSQPDVVLGNIKRSFDLNVPFVTGTTGWDANLELVKQQCLDSDKSLFVASNFSIGVNLFFEVNKRLAALMRDHSDYNISMEEIHHIHKKDAPSGTAISLANQIIEVNESKREWTANEEAYSHQIKIISKRENEVPGTHIINYSSGIDEIEIKHTAKNRIGFALGAVLAAEWIIGKKGFFGMPDMLNI